MSALITDRDVWLDARRAAIGGSDAPAVVGLDPWKGPIDVYLDKIGQGEELEPNAAMEWGNRLEAVVGDHFADTHGTTVTNPGDFYIARHPKHPFMACTPDRYIGGGDDILQIKTTGERMADRWENGPPDHVIVQLQHEIACTNAEYGWIAVLIGGRDYRDYRYERDDELIDMLVEVEGAFWENVLAGTPPPPDGSPTAAEAIARLYPESVAGTEVDIDQLADAVDALSDAKARRAEATDDEKRYKAIIQAALGDNEIGLIDGVPAVTWKTAYPSRWDTKTLEADHPELIDLYKPSRPQRTLLLKGDR